MDTRKHTAMPPREEPYQRWDKTPNILTNEIILTPPNSDIESAAPSPILEQSSHRFEDLLEQLSLQEKVAILSGSSFTRTTGIPRLAVPQLKVSDSINGVRGTQSHLEDSGTACFPSTTCLASTWNRELLREFGKEVGIQAKLRSVQVVIGPNINLHRDPRGGRNFETFSEDPLLTGQLAASIINGMQSTGVGACAKHFVGNESEHKRRKYNVRTSGNSRTIRELYMKAFQQTLRNSNPVSIMMAYNKLEGHFCSQSPLIRTVLRESWKYDGCIMSDWYGVRAGAESLYAGLDLEMPGPSVFRGDKLLKELQEGHVTEQEIDRAARSVLTMIDRTVGSHSDDEELTIICERTSKMARQLAVEGIVLLKNERQVLPLNIRKASSIAVIGTPAAVPVISGGGSACAQPQYIQSFIECLKAEHSSPSLVRYAHGVNPHHCVPKIPLELLRSAGDREGIQVDYYNEDDSSPVQSEFLETPQVVMLGRLKPGLHTQTFHYVITTTLTVPSSGRHTLGAQVTGDFCLDVDGTTILRGTAPDITVEDFLFVPKKLERTTEIFLEANKPYDLRLVVQSRKSANNGEPTPHAAKLVFQEAFDNRQSIAEAVMLAANSDTSIVFAGRTSEHESEGFDLTDLQLDPNQIRLIKAVSAVSRETILVLHHGNPIDLSPVINDVDAILAAHFPGQEGASALTEIVAGRSNPSGRLATTWPLRLDETCVPSFKNFPCTDSAEPEISYEEGLQLGYRNPSASSTSRFAFGHGLSYSNFTVSDLNIFQCSDQQDLPYMDRRLTATVNVHNTGSYPGKYVLQLYVEPPRTGSKSSTSATACFGLGAEATDTNAIVWRPQRELISFAKPYLEPGASKMVELSFLQRDVTSTWDEHAGCWRVWDGKYKFVVADGLESIDVARTELCRVEFALGDGGKFWNGL